MDRTSYLEDAKITHILSVLDFNYCDQRPDFAKYTRLFIQADDVWDENLLQHFTKTNAFISAALKEEESRVLVHCAMGISRSATIVCAYLMWSQRLKADEALGMARLGRSRCDPNAGFMIQLHVYERMLAAGSEREAEEMYQDWLRNRRDEPKL